MKKNNNKKKKKKANSIEDGTSDLQCFRRVSANPLFLIVPTEPLTLLEPFARSCTSLCIGRASPRRSWQHPPCVSVTFVQLLRVSAHETLLSGQMQSSVEGPLNQ